ncbi:hypothetical protein [Nonomuraea sp. NPDC050783]|uniref:hypothetical protein n=1 Tax=Nonomuraea sp. NPDC050783 TaxID=3154634 RepID=UPI003466FF27
MPHATAPAAPSASVSAAGPAVLRARGRAAKAARGVLAGLAGLALLAALAVPAAAAQAAPVQAAPVQAAPVQPAYARAAYAEAVQDRAAQDRAVQGRVVVVGVPGLQWSDLDEARTPALWKLAAQGSSASLSTRAVPPPDRGITCPAAGWLTVSAGQRAGTDGKGCLAPAVPRPGGEGATVPGWRDLVSHQAETGYNAQLGTLGQLVKDAGGKVAAVGPGAALAAADKSGNIAKYAPTLDALGDPAPYHLIVLEAADLADAWSRQPLDDYAVPIPLTAPARQAAVARADARIAALLAELPPGTTTLVAGLSDVTPNAHLHVAVATGPSPTGRPYPRGHLTATSTRQDALVTVTDLTATALHVLGVSPPREVVGRPWQPGAAAPATPAATVAGLADSDLASQVLREVRGPFFTVLVTLQLAFYAWAALALRRRRSVPAGDPPRQADAQQQADAPTRTHATAASTTDRPGGAEQAGRGGTEAGAENGTGGGGEGEDGAGGSALLRAVQVVAVLSGAIAVSTFLAQLVPWWTLPVPMVSVIVTILAIAGLVTAVAFGGPWRRHVMGPLTTVAAITSLALLLDVMTGSKLQVNAVTGYEPVTGGRFYGFSNIAFAVYSTGTILGLAGAGQWLLGRGVPRAVAVGACALYGMFAVFADGWPSWGADFGGVPAFVVGLAVFLILLSGRRVSVLRLLLVGAVGVAIVAALSVFDWLRPEAQRTHLGAFVQQVIDGQAWTVVARKFGAMIGVTVGNWSLTLLSLVALAFLFLVLARPSRYGAAALGQAYALAPALRAGLFGALTCAFVGFLMNDSGIAIPAMALTVAVPLTLAACVRALQLARPTPPGRSSGRAAPTPSEAGPRR